MVSVGGNGGGGLSVGEGLRLWILLFVVGSFLVGGVDRGLMLARWLLSLVDKRCASSCVKLLQRAQSSFVINARMSVKTR